MKSPRATQNLSRKENPQFLDLPANYDAQPINIANVNLDALIKFISTFSIVNKADLFNVKFSLSKL